MEAIHCRKCQHVSLDDSTESWNLALFIKDFSSVLLSMPFLKTVLKSQVWVLFLLTTFLPKCISGTTPAGLELLACFSGKLNDSLPPPPQDTWELLHRILARRLQALPDMLSYKSFGIWFRYHIIRWSALPTISEMIYWPGLELSIL